MPLGAATAGRTTDIRYACFGAPLPAAQATWITRVTAARRRASALCRGRFWANSSSARDRRLGAPYCGRDGVVLAPRLDLANDRRPRHGKLVDGCVIGFCAGCPFASRVEKYDVRNRPWFGAVVGLVVAVASSVQLPGALASLTDVDWQGWYVMQPAAVTAAWIGIVAWWFGRWLLAAIAFAIAVVGPWGFLWPGAVASLALAISAGMRAVRREPSRSAPLS